jgi:hypothetical protein
MHQTVILGMVVFCLQMAFVDCRASGTEVRESKRRRHAEESNELVRRFPLPHPLFSQSSVWQQRIVDVPTKANDQKYIRETYDLLKSTTRRRAEGQNFIWLTFDEFTIPIFAARTDGIGNDELLIRNYDNDPPWPPSTLPSVSRDGNIVVPDVPRPAGIIRPAGPAGDSDGHLVIYDSDEEREYDFWNATTAVDDNDHSQGGGQPGDKILFTGSVEVFEVDGLGAQQLSACCRPLTSARATGVPLLAGLLTPEDLQGGADCVIRHAMVFSLPEMRHMCPGDDGEAPVPPDFVYPATKTETKHPRVKRYALGAGERIRLKPAGSGLWCEDGDRVDEDNLAPITKKYLDALREYGAYLVDGSDAFTFYAEDYRTANLALSQADFNGLLGVDAAAPLPTGERQWEALMACLQEDLRHIALAVGEDEDFRSNFEVVEDAEPPPGWMAPPCSVQQLNDCPDEDGAAR